MFCREVVHHVNANEYDHPLTSRGEEAEAIVAFDNVFIPRERVMALRSPELASVNLFNKWAAYSHWYTFVRTVAKAEMYAGLAQVILEVLELENIPLVRQRVGEISEFAQILQGMCLAAEETAQMSEGGVLVPNSTVVTAARVYALNTLPWILHLLRDICGQGLLLRFSEKDLEQQAAYEQKFSWFLDTQHVSARDKNLLMNLVWDVAASEHSTRSLLFEEQNSLNAPLLRERVFGEYDRSEHANFVRNFINLPPAPTREKRAPQLNQQTSLGGGGHRAFAGGA
jgi:4-hydroxyphenylacetate 3-monooxygenase